MKIQQSVPYPVFTTTERDALTDVLEGWKIKNSTAGKYQMWNGSAWIDIYGDVNVQNVLEYANVGAFPATGAANVIYIAVSPGNKTYRWATEVSPNVYEEVSPAINISPFESGAALGSTVQKNTVTPNTATGAYAVSTGAGARGYLRGMHAHSSFGTNFGQQHGKLTLHANTSDATPTELLTDLTSAKMLLTNNTVYTYKWFGLGVDAVGNVYSEKNSGIVKMVDEFVSLVSEDTNVPIKYTGDFGSEVGITVSVDNLNNALAFSANGVAATNITWTVYVEWVETLLYDHVTLPRIAMTFDDIGNAPASDLSGWNTFFDTSNNADAPFDEMIVDVNTVTLRGPSWLSIKSQLFTDNTYILTCESDIVTSVEDESFLRCYLLSSVSLPLCITVGNNAFNNCSLLSSVSLPLCTSLGDYAFNAGSVLPSIALPECASIGDYSFSGCNALTTVSLPKVTSIPDRAFYLCSLLNSVSIPLATSIGEVAFQACTALTTISLPEVLTIGDGAFTESGLTSISAPKCTTTGDASFASVPLTSASLPLCTSIAGSSFAACSELTSISLPECLSIGVYAFSYCSLLGTVDLPKVTTVGAYAFGDCSVLVGINLPVCTDLGGTTGDDGVFQNIADISISLTIPPALRTDGDVLALQAANTVYISPPLPTALVLTFDNIVNAPASDLAGWNTFFDTGAYADAPFNELLVIDNTVYLTGHAQLTVKGSLFDGNAYLTDISGDTVTSIEPGSFASCANLTDVNFPNCITVGEAAFEQTSNLETFNFESVETIGYAAFVECASLSSPVILPHCTSLGGAAFEACVSITEFSAPLLTSIPAYAFMMDDMMPTVGNLATVDLPLVTSVGNYAFSCCGKITEVSSNNFPSLVTVGNGAFDMFNLVEGGGTALLATVDLPHVTSIGYGSFRSCVATTISAPIATQAGGFDCCPNLTSVSFPEALTITSLSNNAVMTSISAPKATTVEEYLNNNPMLSTVDIPELTALASYTFRNDTSLTSLTFTKVESILYSVFQGCTSLTHVGLPICATIPGGAFDGASALVTVDIPACTYIAGESFKNLTHLENLDITGTLGIDNDAFSGCTSLSSISAPLATTVAMRAFAGCSSLQTANFPAADYVGAYAFHDCTSLTTINLNVCTILGDMPIALYGVFEGIINNTITLTIPPALDTKLDVLYLTAPAQGNTVTIVHP